MVVNTRWGGLRVEPYKANPKDADLDQIVQEGTIWERPATTFIADAFGELIPDGLVGQTLEDRAGLSIVDANGNDVDYTPSWAQQPLSLAERQRTIGQTLGTIGDARRTIGKREGNLVEGPTIDPDKTEALDLLEDADLDDYIKRLSRLERRGRIGKDDAEWLAAARSLREDRDRKKAPDEVDTSTVINPPNGWGETPESVQANKQSDNLQEPNVSVSDVEEAVDGFDWKKAKEERDNLAEGRLKRLYENVWAEQYVNSDENPWDLPVPEDEDGLPIDQDFDEVDQLWNALTEEQQNEWLEKMFLVGEEIELGYVVVDGNRYRLTATHELSDDGIERDIDTGNPDIMGRWNFKVYDGFGNEVYNSNEGPNPTDFGDHKNGGTARSLLVNEKMMIMNYLGTDHTAEFFDNDGNPVEIEFSGLDESLAQIFNDNAFMFATQIGIEKAGLEASSKGQVVWAAQGYDPVKNSYSTIQNLMTTTKLLDSWEQVEALRAAGDLDVENNVEHAKLVLAASVLGSRERYLKVKGMLSGVDTSKLPADTGDLMNTIFSEADVDRVLAEAGTSFDEIPKGGDLLHAILPEGKLRNNVLAFNMWSGSEGARGLSPAERRAAISQVENADELMEAMNTIIRNEGEDITGGIAVWKQLDEPVMPLISASAEQDLKKYTPPERSSLLSRKIVASRRPSKPDPSGNDSRTGVDAFTYGAEVAGDSDELLDGFANSVNEAIDVYTDEPTILEMTGGLQSIMNQDLREDPLEKLAEALNTGKSQGRIRGEYEVVDGRLIRTSRLYPDEKEDVTEAAEFLIGKTREYQVTTEKAQQLVEDPVNSAEGFSGSVAVLVDSGQQAAITTAGIEGLDGIIVSVTQGEDGERTLVSWKPLDAADEIYLGQGMGGFMSCRPIIEGTENVKQVQINTKRLEQIRQDLLADGWSEEEANQMMAFTTLTLINHELLHVWDYQKDDSINRGVWLGQYQPASTIALQAFIMDNITPDMLTEEQKESGQNYRVLLESGVLTDENIRKIADPKQRKQMEALKAIYDTQTMKDMIMSPEEMGFTPEEVEDYWANADEVVARAAQSVLFQETLKKNGLGDFLPQREIELWEAVERELGADAAELLWAVESPFLTNTEDDLTPEQLAYYKQVVEPWYLAQRKALNDAPAEISDAFKGYKLEILRFQRDKNGNYIKSGMPRRRSTDQQKHYEFSPHEVEAMAPEVFKFLDTLDVLEPNFKYEGRDVPAESLELRGNELPPVRVDLDLASSRENLEARISRLGSRLADRGPATSQTSDSRRIRQERSVSTVLTDILRPRPKREVDTSAVKESVVLDTSTARVLSNRDSEAAYEVVSAVQSADAFIEDGKKVGVISRSIPEEETAQGMYDADSHTIILSDGVTKANASSTLVHELGHAYDYQEGTSKVAAAESTIAESAVYKNLEAKYIGEPESRLDAIDNRVTNYTPVTVKKSEIATVLGEEQGTLFAYVRKQLGDENASDEKVFDAIFGSDFFESSDELTLDASNNLVAKSLGMMGFNDADEHVRFLQTLENVSDDEFEELLQDLPFAAQSRAIYLRGLTTSDKFKTIQKYDKEQSSYSLLASGQGQKVLKEALTKEIQLWVDGKESERVQNVSELVGKVEERLDAEFVAMRYTMRSEELWGFGYQQGLQFNRISELAGSDENGKDIIRIMQDAGVMDEFSSELAQLKKDNPELYQAVETYIENFAVSANPSNTYYYVQDLDEVQNLRDNLVNVINDDGNGALPNAPSYDKASVRINREDRGKLVERFYDNEEESLLSEQELIEAIPDGKLDIYIDAFENYNEVEGELDQDEIDGIIEMREELAQKIRAEKQRRATSDFYSDPVLSTTRRSDEDRPAFSRAAPPSGPPPSGPPPPAPDEPEITPPPDALPFDASLNRRAREIDMTLTPELRDQWDAERQRISNFETDPEMQERRMQQIFDNFVRDNPELVRKPPPGASPLGRDPEPLEGTFAYNESLGLPPPNFDIDEPEAPKPPPVPLFEEEPKPRRGGRRIERLYNLGLASEGDDNFVNVEDITSTNVTRRQRAFLDEFREVSEASEYTRRNTNRDTWLDEAEWYDDGGALLPDPETFMAWVEKENVRDARENPAVQLYQVEKGNLKSPFVDFSFRNRTDNYFNNLDEFPDRRVLDVMSDSELENYMVTLEWTLSQMEKDGLDELPITGFSNNPIRKDDLLEEVLALRKFYASSQRGDAKKARLNPRYRRDRRERALEPFNNEFGGNLAFRWERDRRILGGDRRDRELTTREIFEQRNRGPAASRSVAGAGVPPTGGPPSGPPPPAPDEPDIPPPPDVLPFDASLNRRAREIDMTLTPELRELWDAERQRISNFEADPEMQERRMQQVFDNFVRDNPELVRKPPPGARPLGGDPDPLEGTFAYNERFRLPPPNVDIDEPEDSGPPPMRPVRPDGIGVDERGMPDYLRPDYSPERYGIGVEVSQDDEVLSTDIPKRRRAFTDELAFSSDAPDAKINRDDWLDETEWYGESGALLPDVGTFSAWVEKENVRDSRNNSAVQLRRVDEDNPNSPLVDFAFRSRTDNAFRLNEFPDKRYLNAMDDRELENYMLALEWTLSDMTKNDLDELPFTPFSSNPVSRSELAENVMSVRAYYSSRQLGNEKTSSLNPRYRRDRRQRGREPFKNERGGNMGFLWEKDRRIISGDRRNANDRTTREVFEKRRGPELQGPRASRGAPASSGPPSSGPPPSREAARARQRRARVPVDRTNEPFTESGSRLQDSPLQENGIYISQEAPGLFTVSYGDLETEIVIEDNYNESFAEGDGYSDWAMWEGNYRLRNIAANLMGHAPPKAGGSEVAAMSAATEDRILNSIIATGELQEAGLSDEQLQNIGRLVLNARKGIRDINNADEDAPDLYRGIEAPDGSEILDLEAGDSFVLTLSAFSPSENMASGFAGLPFGSEVWTPESGREKPEFDEGSKPVVFKLKQGSKAIAPPADDWSMEDDMDEGLSIEYITQGEFVISDVRDRGDGVRIIEIEQIATYGDYGLDRNPSVTPQRYDEITKGPRVEEGPEGIKTMKANPIQELADKHGEKRNWESVTAIDPDRRVSIADAYEQAEEVTPENMTEEARESFEALGSEIEEQFDMVTKPVSEGGLGITVEFVDEDPYDNFIEMYEDYTENKTIKILKTEATGGHPFFTNEQNDKFRAVHDLFGHLATGRGFDRHGEEAAYQAHKSMFSETAAKAAATELRGQNSYLLEKGDFGPQKLILLPESMRKGLAGWFTMLTKVAGMQPAQSDADADNLFELSNSHHVSCGRILQKD